MDHNNYSNPAPMLRAPSRGRRKVMPHGWHYRTDEYGRIFYIHEDGRRQTPPPRSAPTSPSQPPQNQMYYPLYHCAPVHQAIAPVAMPPPPPPLPAPLSPLPPPPVDLPSPVAFTSPTYHQEQKRRRTRPLSPSILRGADVDNTTVMSSHITHLVLRDGLWREHGTWEVADLNGYAWFRYQSKAEHRHTRKELFRASGRGMYAASATAVTLHSRMFIVNADDKSDTKFTMRKKDVMGRNNFQVFRGNQDFGDAYLNVVGSVREGSLVIYQNREGESVPVAKVLRPELNPRLRVKEGEYGVHVAPYFNVGLACIVALLVDNLQRA